MIIHLNVVQAELVGIILCLPRRLVVTVQTTASFPLVVSEIFLTCSMPSTTVKSAIVSPLQRALSVVIKLWRLGRSAIVGTTTPSAMTSVATLGCWVSKIAAMPALVDAIAVRKHSAVRLKDRVVMAIHASLFPRGSTRCARLNPTATVLQNAMDSQQIVLNRSTARTWRAAIMVLKFALTASAGVQFVWNGTCRHVRWLLKMCLTSTNGNFVSWHVKTARISVEAPANLHILLGCQRVGLV